MEIRTSRLDGPSVDSRSGILQNHEENFKFVSKRCILAALFGCLVAKHLESALTAWRWRQVLLFGENNVRSRIYLRRCD